MIHWISRHELSPAQKQALLDLHGDVQVVRQALVFEDVDGLRLFIESIGEDDFVYAVAGAPHYLAAALSGCEFGVFLNHPGRRADGTFGLHYVFHVVANELTKVWENPDPTSDEGERLDVKVERPVL